MNKDGSISHGGKPFRLTKDWAEALRREDFSITKSRLVESQGHKATVQLDAALIDFLVELQAYLSSPDG